MVTYVSKSMAMEGNLFDLSTSFSGWVTLQEEVKTPGFYTSDYIAVAKGDRLTFAPAVCYQGWHLVLYNRKKEPIRRGTISTGVTIREALDDETGIMQYTVGPDAFYLRVICDVRYANAFFLTKNRPFTAEEFRQKMLAEEAKGLTRRAIHPIGVWTLSLNLQGSGTITVNGKAIPFEPGTLVCVPPNRLIQKESEEGFLDICLYVDRFLLGEKTNETLVCSDDANRNLFRMFQLMLQVFWEQEALYHRFVEQLYVSAEQLIAFQLQKKEPYVHQVGQMVAAMQMGFTNADFSAEELFAQTQYHPNYLRRMFRQKMGCTPVEYLLKLRIGYAVRLLKENHKLGASISQIAAMAGFRDCYYFSRVFKKLKGISPTEYMKQNQTV